MSASIPYDTCTEGDTGGGGALNTTIPQKNLPIPLISQKKLPNTAILQYCVETLCRTETATLYIKFRANNTETEIKFWKCLI